MRCPASASHAVLRPAVRWSRAATAVFGLALACGVPTGAQPAGQTATPGEYGRFLTMLLSGGTFRGRRILSESSVSEMLRDQTRGKPLRFNPFESFPGVFPGWREVRYGLCSWLETLDAATGQAWEASSPGVFGFIPWIDRRRQLAGVFVAQSDMEKSLSVYLRLKILLRKQIGQAQMSQRDEKP